MTMWADIVTAGLAITLVAFWFLSMIRLPSIRYATRASVVCWDDTIWTTPWWPITRWTG
jgi:hypothetical protein